MYGSSNTPCTQCGVTGQSNQRLSGPQNGCEEQDLGCPHARSPARPSRSAPRPPPDDATTAAARWRARPRGECDGAGAGDPSRPGGLARGPVHRARLRLRARPVVPRRIGPPTEVGPLRLARLPPGQPGGPAPRSVPGPTLPRLPAPGASASTAVGAGGGGNWCDTCEGDGWQIRNCATSTEVA